MGAKIPLTISCLVKTGTTLPFLQGESGAIRVNDFGLCEENTPNFDLI
jgi:hypothetical protein